jgi:hypothetical protein
VRGCTTGTGAWLLHREEDTNSYLSSVNHHCPLDLPLAAYCMAFGFYTWKVS